MTKLFKHWIVVPTTLAAILASVVPIRAETLEIRPKFEPDPLVVRGTSGGSKDSQGCGKIGTAPNLVMNLSNNFNYLRLEVQSEGQPTLLIQSPSGSLSCVLYDSSSGNTIQSSGFWELGTYLLYIGDRTGEQHPYTLSITQVRPKVKREAKSIGSSVKLLPGSSLSR